MIESETGLYKSITPLLLQLLRNTQQSFELIQSTVKPSIFAETLILAFWSTKLFWRP